MTINKQTILIYIIYILIVLYFINLFSSHEVKSYWSVYLFIITIIIFNYSYNKFKDLINPISLLIPLQSAYIFYSLMLSTVQNELNINTKALFYIFNCSYLLGAIIDWKVGACRENYQKKYVFHVANVLICLSIAVTILEAYMSGGFPIILSIFNVRNIYNELVLIHVFHYLVMLSALLPGVYYWCHKKNILKKSYFYVLSIIAFVIVVNTLSRQIIILMLIVFYLTYIKFNALSVRKMIIYFIGLIAVFIVIGNLRITNITDSISPLNYLKAYSSVPNEFKVNLFDVTFNLYAARNYNTLNDMITLADGNKYYGLYFLQPLLGLPGIKNIFIFPPAENLNGFVQLATILIDPYLDFGYFGILIFGFIYGYAAKVIYIKYKRSNNIRYVLYWGLIVFCMVMSVFANFFNVLFFWIVIIYAILITVKIRLYKQSSYNNTPSKNS